MQTATHKYSSIRGTIIGYHSDRDIYLIKTYSGKEQYWTNDSTLKGDYTMSIKIKLTGPHHDIIERYFEEVKDAQDYLKEMSLFNDIRCLRGDNQEALLSNGWSISSNYNIKKLLKNNNKKLKLNKILNTTVTIPSNYSKKRKKKVSDNIIKLQELTNNPRKARVILRNLVRQKKIEKPTRWEWESNSKDLVIVKKSLSA